MISTEGQTQGCSSATCCSSPTPSQCRRHLQQQFPQVRMWHSGSCLLEGTDNCPLLSHPPQKLLTQPWTDLNAAFRASPRTGGDTQPNIETDCSERKNPKKKDLQHEKTEEQGQGRANWSSVTSQRGKQSKPTSLKQRIHCSNYYSVSCTYVCSSFAQTLVHKLQLSLEFPSDSSHTKHVQPFGDGEKLQAEHGSATLTIRDAGENCREHNLS